MVAADHSRCSQIGRDILYKGGNAADAAVATTLCLGVVNPVSSGLGGGAFIMVRWANGSSSFIDGRETAPAAAHASMYDGGSQIHQVAADSVGACAVARVLVGALTELGWRPWGWDCWGEQKLVRQQ
jgi:gamma-glutamyltranspeptidase/glutathione hydrolase/leukotriene-C4 hydrolase